MIPMSSDFVYIICLFLFLVAVLSFPLQFLFLFLQALEYLFKFIIQSRMMLIRYYTILLLEC